MIVIADTTPLNHLILVDQADLLRALYGRVIIPQAVLSELQAYATPPAVKAWVSKRPDWLEVNHSAFDIDPGLARLDPGERDAILLAERLGADLLLVDDLGGRREAARRRLKIAGDGELNELGFNQNIVVTVPGNTRFYILLGTGSGGRDTGSRQAATSVPVGSKAATMPSLEELRQLMQLRQELSAMYQQAATPVTTQTPQ